MTPEMVDKILAHPTYKKLVYERLPGYWQIANSYGL